jgi:hypothetical protein
MPCASTPLRPRLKISKFPSTDLSLHILRMAYRSLQDEQFPHFLVVV